MEPKRFDTEKQARGHARQVSKDGDTLAFVTESPRPSDPRLGRFVVDNDPACRDWEKRLAAFYKGEEDPV